MYIEAYSKCIKNFFNVSKYVKNRIYYGRVDMITPIIILHNAENIFIKNTNEFSLANNLMFYYSLCDLLFYFIIYSMSQGILTWYTIIWLEVNK